MSTKEITRHELLEAVRARHSVRQYKALPIEPETVAALQREVWRCNAGSGLHIQLVLNEPRAFAPGMFKYGVFTGASNYLVMAAPKGRSWEEKVGWYGEHLVLFAQALGLNSCWVGLTYKKIPGTYILDGSETVHCVIALGYGQNPGVMHKQRPTEDFMVVKGEVPAWFRAGMEAAMLAPTATHQQKYRFILHEGNVVEARTTFSLAGYTTVDLGIVKYHFELAAGKENFRWQ